MRIQDNWNERQPQTIVERMVKSLETKWGSVKHDVSKFHGIYLKVKAINKSGKNEDYLICDYFRLYQLKHPKVFDFGFEHCWHI